MSRLGIILFVSLACLKASSASLAGDNAGDSVAAGKAWSMLVIFNDDTSVKINVTEGSLITFSDQKLCMGDFAAETSRISGIRFIPCSDSVEETSSPEFTVIVRRESIEITGESASCAPVAIYDFGGQEADVPVYRAASDFIEVDCRSLPPGHWILKVKDKSLKFTR